MTPLADEMNLHCSVETPQGNSRDAEAAEIAEADLCWIVTLWVSGARNNNDF